MKYLTLAILALATIALGACAHHDATTQSSYSAPAPTSGYSK